MSPFLLRLRYSAMHTVTALRSLPASYHHPYLPGYAAGLDVGLKAAAFSVCMDGQGCFRVDGYFPALVGSDTFGPAPSYEG